MKLLGNHANITSKSEVQKEMADHVWRRDGIVLRHNYKNYVSRVPCYLIESIRPCGISLNFYRSYKI